MKVLAIGNSFSACLHRQLPPMAAAEGRGLALATLSIAGCTLDRHAENLAKSAADPSFRPYGARCVGFAAGEWPDGEFNASAGEMLAHGGWDVVVLQQGSSKSWDYATYQPHGHAVVEAVRKACPKAEIVVQQTWAYRADDVCIRDGGLWGFGQDEMAERVFAAYDRFAADEKIARLIPTGRAVWLSRKRETSPFRPYDPAALDACRWPDLPPQAGDVVGRLKWSKSADTGEMEIVRDTIHLNERGEYLQALVWFGFLFGVDPAFVSYVSPSVGKSDAAFLRGCASDALAGRDNVVKRKASTTQRCTRDRFIPEDFTTAREDGRYESDVAWARDMLMNMRPAYSLDMVTCAGDFPGWRAKVRSKLHELLQIPDPLPTVEFKLLKEEPREGYRLRTYEFHPEPKLAVRMLMLVPDEAAEGKVRAPAMVSLPGGGASLESLAGEPDEYPCRFPSRNRQSWFFAKMGVVGVALENPATANNGVEGVSQWASQMQFARLMALAGRSNWGFATAHVLETIRFLRSLPFIDSERIGVSGMSLGCIPALYAAVLDDGISAVIYNDFVCSWAARATAVTDGIDGNVDARRPFGFHRWFDDQPDLMAAVAPRPMILSEGGSWRNCIEKVKRGYELAGAPGNLTVRHYEKFADPASRKYEDVDLHKVQGLTDDDYLLHSNVDAPQHSFHPDVNLPWLAGLFTPQNPTSAPWQN